MRIPESRKSTTATKAMNMKGMESGMSQCTLSVDCARFPHIGTAAVRQWGRRPRSYERGYKSRRLCHRSVGFGIFLVPAIIFEHGPVLVALGHDDFHILARGGKSDAIKESGVVERSDR